MAKTRGGSRRRVGRRSVAVPETPRQDKPTEEIVGDSVPDEHDEAEIYDDAADDEFACNDGDDEFVVEDVDHIPVEENANAAAEVLATHFGNVAGDTADDSENSADEAWRDDLIPDPLSEDEDEEGFNGDGSGNLGTEEGEADILKLGKCFTSPSEFKLALLRYSLMSRYDVKLYISTGKKLGAICSDKEKLCKWRVYCSYEKRKNKLQVKVYEPDHTCSNCHTEGHNKASCKSASAEPTTKKPRGRPRKTPVASSVASSQGGSQVEGSQVSGSQVCGTQGQNSQV